MAAQSKQQFGIADDRYFDRGGIFQLRETVNTPVIELS